MEKRIGYAQANVGGKKILENYLVEIVIQNLQ